MSAEAAERAEQIDWLEREARDARNAETRPGDSLAMQTAVAACHLMAERFDRIATLLRRPLAGGEPADRERALRLMAAYATAVRASAAAPDTAAYEGTHGALEAAHYALLEALLHRPLASGEVVGYRWRPQGTDWKWVVGDTPPDPPVYWRGPETLGGPAVAVPLEVQTLGVIGGEPLGEIAARVEAAEATQQQTRAALTELSALLDRVEGRDPLGELRAKVEAMRAAAPMARRPAYTAVLLEIDRLTKGKPNG